MTQKQKLDPTRKAVKDYYGERARSSSSCCSSETSFYNSSEIDVMPAEVSNFSLGCGNAVGASELQPGETVLDLGSGGGLECFIAARQVGETGNVIGIDMTQDMLDRARASAERMGFENVEFREGLIEALPVESASIDVIISNCVINLSPDKPAVFREMHRVLKTGGRLAISDVVSTAPIPQKYQDDMELWSACASGAVTVSDWTEELTRLGFVDVEIVAVDDDDEYVKMIPESRPFSAIIRAVKST
jgi:SAM-dependent methyltransferase